MPNVIKLTKNEPPPLRDVAHESVPERVIAMIKALSPATAGVLPRGELLEAFA